MGETKRWTVLLWEKGKEKAGELLGSTAGGVVGAILGGPPGAAAGSGIGFVVASLGPSALSSMYQRASAAWVDPEVSPHLNLRRDHARAHYGGPTGSSDGWLGSGEQVAPYLVEVDYTREAIPGWGDYEVVGPYAFPEALSRHRDLMVEQFREDGALWVNNTVLRLAGLTRTPGAISYKLEHAHYTDQVGTNLSLDRPLDLPINGATTPRAWDRLHVSADLGVRRLPSVESSRLANNIGVAVAITVGSGASRVMAFRPRKQSGLAVYRRMAHPACTFALLAEPGLPPRGTLRELVAIGLERALDQELGMTLDEFYPVKPLVLCRDLGRGGKPQLFLHLESKYSTLDEYRRRVSGGDDQFDSSGSGVTAGEHRFEVREFSPELVACLLLLGF